MCFLADMGALILIWIPELLCYDRCHLEVAHGDTNVGSTPCGKEWRSDTYTFDLKGFELPIDEKIRSMLWNQQHEEAYERANREAGAVFSRCQDCGCRICDDCLIQVELEKDGKCKDCADNNH
jgi:hypothetical protein